MTGINVRGAWIAVALALTLAGCESAEERIAGHYESGMALLEEDAPEKAVLEFRNALSLDENHAPSRYEIARLYEADGDLKAAAGNYRLVTELDAAHIGARVKLGQLLLALGQVEDAARWIEEAAAIEGAQSDIEVLSLLAALRLRQDNPTEAVAFADQALAIDPGHVGAIVVKATERLEADDPDASLALLDAAIAAAPEEQTFAVLKLRVLETIGDDEGLGAQLALMVERYPENTAYATLLARWHIGREDMESAERALRAIADADPTNEEATDTLVRFIIATRGLDAAREELVARAATVEDAERRAGLLLSVTALDWEADRRDEAVASLRSMIDNGDLGDSVDRGRTQLAGYLVELEQPDAAGALVEDVLSRDPENVDALAVRASLLIEAYKPGEAIRDLRIATDLAPRNPRLLMLLARAYDRDGSPDLASERMAAATRIANFQPEYAGAYARYLSARGRFEAAETVLAESAQRNPGNQQILLALAEIRLRIGDFRGAEEIARQLANSPDTSDVAERIGAAVLAGEGRSEDSIAALERLADAADGGGEPDQGVLTALVAAYVRAGEIDRADTLIEEQLRLDPTNARALLLRAELDLRRGAVDVARERLQTLIDSAPQSAVGYTSMTSLLLRTGQREEAEKVARLGLANAEPSEPVRLLLAQLLETQGDWEEAIEHYEILYTAQPEERVLANNLASLLAEHRADDPESLRRATQIAQRLRGSDVPHFQDTYGWLRYLRGEYVEALRMLTPAAEALPNNPIVRFHTGMAFAKAGQPTQARQHLEAALSLDPEFLRADEARETLAGLSQTQ